MLLFLKNCGIILSAIRSRLGQRLGQKKAAHKKRNLRKAKVLEIRRFRGLLSNDYKKDIFAISAGDSERSRS